MPLSAAQIAALAAPPVLIASLYWAFQRLHGRFGRPLGYLLGFAVYWLVWCIALPVILLGGPGGALAAFRPTAAPGQPDGVTHLLLWWPVLFPLFFTFLPRVRKAGPAILLVSVALGVVIAVTEELLWRGVYLTLFPGSLLWGILYPSLAFGLWHLAPMSVVKNRMPGGWVSFVGYAVLLGLTYAFAAQRTGSIFWPVVAHAVHDTLGLGGFAYAAWLGKDHPPQESRAGV